MRHQALFLLINALQIWGNMLRQEIGAGFSYHLLLLVPFFGDKNISGLCIPNQELPSFYSSECFSIIHKNVFLKDAMIIALALASPCNVFSSIIGSKIMGASAAKKGLHYGDISQKVGKRLFD